MLTRKVTGVPTGVGSVPVATPAGASPSSSTMAGMPPGQVDEASSSWRSRRTRRRSSSMPIWSTTHFRRARSLLSRLPKWSKVRRMASMVGQQVLPGR